MVSVQSTKLQSIEQLYTLVERDGVLQFLEGHDFLAPLLLEAHDRIDDYFPSSQLFLSVVVDPEGVPPADATGNVDTLVLSIATRLDPIAAMEKLDQLDHNWWLDALPQAQGRLCINLEFR